MKHLHGASAGVATINDQRVVSLTVFAHCQVELKKRQNTCILEVMEHTATEGGASAAGSNGARLADGGRRGLEIIFCQFVDFVEEIDGTGIGLTHLDGCSPGVTHGLQ